MFTWNQKCTEGSVCHTTMRKDVGTWDHHHTVITSVYTISRVELVFGTDAAGAGVGQSEKEIHFLNFDRREFEPSERI